MRMVHYFGLGVALAVPALLATAAFGIFGDRVLHLKVGLVTAIFTVGVHTLLILFMIVTGRVLKAAMASRELPPRFLAELNEFFTRKRAYPLAVFSAVAIVAAAVLGYGAPALGLSPIAHMLAGLAALVLNLLAFPIELRTLRSNQSLIDRAATVLDEIDSRLDALGQPVVDEARFDPARMARAALIVAVSAWMPYLYWALIVWRGDFSKTSLHPWLEVSAMSLFVWMLARREARATAQTD